MGSNINQIFVSHSSQDDRLIDLITLTFKDREIVPFFARRIMVGENPVEKIINAIENSMALFLLMTSKVVHYPDTRDWVVFELAVAKVKNIPIFCWMDKEVAETKMFPKLLENITDYDTFDHQDEEYYRMVASMLQKAFELKGTPRKVEKLTKEELKEGLIQMEEAKHIAVEFVRNEKKPTSITISSVEPKGNRWIVKGSVFTKFKGGGSERWTVEIDGKNIVSCKFETGGFFAVL